MVSFAEFLREVALLHNFELSECQVRFAEAIDRGDDVVVVRGRRGGNRWLALQLDRYLADHHG